MFTGIVTAIGRVESVDAGRADRRYTLSAPWDMGTVPLGASIACAGCCLTVVEKTRHGFSIDVSRETLSKTNLGSWTVGAAVNLEASLKLGDTIGGHLVSGHVDGLAMVESVAPEGGSHRITLRAPEALSKFIAPKGCVALDGVSLTVNDVDGAVFGVNIIPHTWAVTTFGQAQAGDALNLEVDMLARYVARMLNP